MLGKIKNIISRIDSIPRSKGLVIGSLLFIDAGMFFITHTDKIHTPTGASVLLAIGAICAIASVIHKPQAN